MIDSELPTQKSIFPLAVSVIGNLFLSGIFLYALILPLKNENFILNTSVAIYAIEFLSIHSGAMLSAQAKEKAHRGIISVFYKTPLIFLYSIFAFGIGFGTKNFFLPIMFFISLVAKAYAKKAKSDAKIGVSVVLLMSTLLAAIFGAQLAQKIYPLPEYLYNLIMERSSGMENSPLLFIVWGILYFFFAAAIEIFIFYKGEPRFTNFQKAARLEFRMLRKNEVKRN